MTLFEFAIMTGCMRTVDGGRGNSLSHLNVHGITSNAYGEFFGFTENEVLDALKYHNLESEMDVIKDRYNGYLFCGDLVYNPCSIIKYLSDVQSVKDKNKVLSTLPEPYWSNTNFDSIIKDLIDDATTTTIDEIETLIKGGTITKPIKEKLVYSEINQSLDHLWNFLFFTGYLSKVSESIQWNQVYYEMKIPNKEILNIYKIQIKEWFDKKIKETSLDEIHEALLTASDNRLQEGISDILLETVFYQDNDENFYYEFLMGILAPIKGYNVKPNRETGTNRSGIYLEPKSRHTPAIIIEIKIAKTFEEIESKCDEALTQIETKKYVQDLNQSGFTKVAKVGIAFCGKDCEVKSIW